MPDGKGTYGNEVGRPKKRKRLEKKLAKLETKSKKLESKKEKRHKKLVAKTDKINVKREKKGKSKITIEDTYKKRFKVNKLIKNIASTAVGLAVTGPTIAKSAKPLINKVVGGVLMTGGVGHTASDMSTSMKVSKPSVVTRNKKTKVPVFTDKPGQSRGYTARVDSEGKQFNTSIVSDGKVKYVNEKYESPKGEVKTVVIKPKKGDKNVIMKEIATRTTGPRANMEGNLDYSASVANPNVLGIDHKYAKVKEKINKTRKKLGLPVK